MSSSSEDPRRATVLRDARTRSFQFRDVVEGGGLVDPVATAEAAARGYDDGYGAGWEEGHRAGLEAAHAEAAAAESDQAARVERAVAALAAAATAYETRRVVALSEIEDTVSSAALSLAEAILQRELLTADDPGADALARALALVPEVEVVTARLHPDDLAVIGDLTDLIAARQVTVVADPAVERGGCLLDAGPARVDACLGTAVARARGVLS